MCEKVLIDLCMKSCDFLKNGILFMNPDRFNGSVSTTELQILRKNMFLEYELHRLWS